MERERAAEQVVRSRPAWIQRARFPQLVHGFSVPSRQNERRSHFRIDVGRKRIKGQCATDLLQAFVNTSLHDENRGPELQMGERIVRVELERPTEPALGFLPGVFAGANRRNRPVALGEHRIDRDSSFRSGLCPRQGVAPKLLAVPMFRSMAINASAIPPYAMA